MAYQAKRKKIYMEDFELAEEDGTVVYTLHVELDPDSVVKKLSEKQIALTKALQDITQMDDNATGAEKLIILGQCVTDLLEAVFGKEDAGTILLFYKSRYIEITNEILPFVINTVIPEVRKLSKESRKQLARSYDRPHCLFGK